MLEAYNKKDLTSLLSFFADDATYIRSEGTFRGKEEIKRYYTWGYSNYSEVSLTEKGIIVEGDRAVLEWALEGTSVRGGGKKAQLQGLDLFEFKNGKVQEVHIYQDRLLIATQLASGWFEKTIINAVVNRMEKGLR
jgi:ketosteroid isomerase-like protein